jgi:hypothetical protein
MGKARGRPWTSEDDRLLRDLAAAGKNTFVMVLPQKLKQERDVYPLRKWKRDEDVCPLSGYRNDASRSVRRARADRARGRVKRQFKLCRVMACEPVCDP